MDSFLSSLIPSSSQHNVGWEDAPFLARLVGVYTPTSGALNGISQYSFVEQAYDPVTSTPVDLPGGRQTVNASGLVFGQTLPVTAQPLGIYAVELNNSLLTIPGSTPTGYTNPGPYYMLRLMGPVQGVPVYQFASSSAPVWAWVKITSTTPTTITLPGGSTTTGYAALVDTWNGTTGNWADGTTPVWFIDINGNTPTLHLRYQCRQLGSDQSGVAIWGSLVPQPSAYSGALYYGPGTGTSIPSGTTQILSTGGMAVQYDTDGYSSSLVVPTGGYYRGWFQVELPGVVGATNAGFFVAAMKGGTANIGQVTGQFCPNTAEVQVNFQAILTPGAGVSVEAYQGSGSTVSGTVNIAFIEKVGN